MSNIENKNEVTAEQLEAFAAEIELLIEADDRETAVANTKAELSDFLALNFVHQVEMIMAYKLADAQMREKNAAKASEEPTEPTESAVSDVSTEDGETPKAL
jgi:hypothetical protein